MGKAKARKKDSKKSARKSPKQHPSSRQKNRMKAKKKASSRSSSSSNPRISSKDMPLPPQISFIGKKIPRSLTVTPFKSENNPQHIITHFTLTSTTAEQAKKGLLSLLRFGLFDSNDHLALALQGLGYSSNANDTMSFCLRPSWMKNDPFYAKLSDFFNKLGGVRVKKITFNPVGGRTGEHKDDIASHKKGTSRYILQYTEGSTGLFFDGFDNTKLKFSGLSLIHIGQLELHYKHWRESVEQNTVVFILDVDNEQSNAFPEKLFEALGGIGKKETNIEEPKIFEDMADKKQYTTAIVAAYGFQLARLLGLGTNEYNGIFKKQDLTVAEFEEEVRNVTNRLIEVAEKEDEEEG
eukprot:CAMPEP_0182503318 /NCGR_PEP_ID=MMETSP1321-20130603/15105_1 /TAXON_ID=91990 /ORGANISM="Bolidomonas sp., Strain RCC1657" /LENGTH=351 /DNA_ID=CAMNT_0024708469 /DNA_START=409 /DNA_END=1460 /DNA_ORIENTATION=+